MNIIGVTGHRSLKRSIKDIKKDFIDTFLNLEGTKVITGMAIGYDQLVAECCVENNVPFIAAVPFKGQEKLWPDFIKTKYEKLLSKAEEIKIVSDGEYAAWKMHVRNEWIVNNSTKYIISYFDGNHIKGSGTSACIKYAIKKAKLVFNVF